MSRKLGFIIDPLTSINPKKDTTLAMMWAAQSKGFEIFCFEQRDLDIKLGTPVGHATQVRASKNLDHPIEILGQQPMALADLDAILMRKDPPFDMNFIYTTYILDLAKSLGTLVLNNPGGLRDCNEKLFATHFPQCCPPVLVSSDADRLKAFHKEHKDVIYKPLDGMGGTGIFRAKEGDSNLSVIIETLTELGTTPIMAQTYLPEIKQGDKRILIVDGQPLDHCLARIPASGELRGNIAAGGRGEVQPITDRDRWLCNQIIPELQRRELLFVGVDVIGDYITEINVTSPTCAREIAAASGIDATELLIEAILKRIQ